MRSNHSSPNTLRHFLYFYYDMLDYNVAIFAIPSVAHLVKRSLQAFLIHRITKTDNNNQTDLQSQSPSPKNAHFSLPLHLTGYEPGFVSFTQPSYQLYLPIFLHSIIFNPSQYTQLVTTVLEDDRIRIPKLKNAKNHRPWAICIQAALEGKAIWKIIDGTIKKPMLPSINATQLK